MISAFGRDWWPAAVRRPWLRLAAGVILAPLIVAAAATGLAFLVFGMNLPDAQSVTEATVTTGLTIVAALGALALTLGLAAVAGLWAARLRSVLAFGLAGAAAGVLFALAAMLGFGNPAEPATIAALAILGAVQFAVLRAVAGVRRVQ